MKSYGLVQKSGVAPNLPIYPPGFSVWIARAWGYTPFLDKTHKYVSIIMH